ncbi:UDP-glucosyltransferase 2 isoform X2 [Leptinotarsa decemlineata]|uniref:UDP-glucosyltransferase 2 isoform X2 n=1 Tax=Leptinotarsa decemlineata TaxID=7539 RepID=UPI003D304526
MRLTIVCIALFANYVQSSKVLGFFPAPSISHQRIFQPIWKELSLRGHEVTVITPDILNDLSLVNLTEIDVRIGYKVFEDLKLLEKMKSKNFVLIKILNIFHDIQRVMSSELQHEAVKKLIENDAKYFDVVLLQTSHLFPLVYGFGTKFSAPVIGSIWKDSLKRPTVGLPSLRRHIFPGISSMDLYLHAHDAVGNPTHPLVAPDIMLNLHGKLGFFDKISSVLHNILYRILYYWYALPMADKVARKHFGENIPYLGDVEKNMSLILTTVNPIIHPIRPNVPNMIEINQIHIREKKPLPKDLQDYLDSAPEGVVYFSLGSNVKSANISSEIRNIIIEALSELPYKVLWKWETDYLPNQPYNVLTRKWIPQQDVLGHPNIKVFITQGGLQSIEEAICNEVPMVGLPYITDQPYNVRKLEEFGIAIGLNPGTMTKDQFKRAILEVAGNKKYKERVREAKAILTDQPMKGVEKAVWWIEYVIRHKGAKHLRSPAADLSFFEYFLVDVALFFVFCALLLTYVVVKMIRWCRCRSKKGLTKEKAN